MNALRDCTASVRQIVARRAIDVFTRSPLTRDADNRFFGATVFIELAVKYHVPLTSAGRPDWSAGLSRRVTIKSPLAVLCRENLRFLEETMRSINDALRFPRTRKVNITSCLFCRAGAKLRSAILARRLSSYRRNLRPGVVGHCCPLMSKIGDVDRV